ncbi:MAG TPA: tol-pal system-associated acyl-CoA thioesterase [Alphaproteobacteria bacterium]|nr:tol-pal system-associated acyl-CoA thioesterase [Rhodospirillaceae bacterium]HRJ11880.1 tol-pal system-associated acyl-CoA thioesterase [Alphaproteobacteria bacterium]
MKHQSAPVHQLPIRVYWEDTDGGGIVYYANYLKFTERARTEWLRGLGFDQSKLRDEAGVLFVVREANIRYRQPARLDDELTITVEPQSHSAHKILLRQLVRCGEVICAELQVELVVVDAATGKLAAIPEKIQNSLI